MTSLRTGMTRGLRTGFGAVAAAAVLLVLAPCNASALQVFAGDPVDPSTSLAYPVMPGLPLLLPGPDKTFGTGDDVVDKSITGDVDIVVRAGIIAPGTLPPPGGASVLTTVAGGGDTGQGAEVPFTVILSDGSGTYGNAITNTELDARPVAVYAFADLDGDGFIGPTLADHAAEGHIEEQETTAFAGRQVGVFSQSRLQASIGLELAAPASVGGLGVVLVAGAYTGNNNAVLDSDGTLILTHWPFLPPLDPNKVLDLTNPHPPDPNFPSQLEFDIGEQYLPPPDDAALGNAFKIALDGSDPTTDHVVVDSGPAVSAAFFVAAANATFGARHSTIARVAPAPSGPGRQVVIAPERVVLADVSSQRTLRLLPVDRFGNVADLASSMPVTLRASGELAIVSPDTNSDPMTESLSLTDAHGMDVTIGATGNDGGRIDVVVGGVVVASLPFVAGAAADTDGDGVPDDGSASGLGSDKPCDGAGSGCDDNCPNMTNPSQLDSDHNGIGDCCDGVCLVHPELTGCAECAPAVPPPVGSISSVKLRMRRGNSGRPDSLALKVAFSLLDAASEVPDSLTASLALTQAGHGGFHADVSSIARDPVHDPAFYELQDPAGSQGGVTLVQIRQRTGITFRGVIRAGGAGLADVAGGSAHLAMSIGGEAPFDNDDVLAVDLACTASAMAVRCSMP
ncbi:MAG TPA: hypothetical protein VGK20_12230 [Candidatus Binatia bacterium]|jgi:hypothetical protein